MRVRSLMLALMTLSGGAYAQTEEESAAMLLTPPSAAGEAQATPPGVERYFGFEAAASNVHWRDDAFAGPVPASTGGRLSTRWRLRQPLASNLRFVLSDAIDIGWRRHERFLQADDIVHTLQEAYVSLQAGRGYLDFGRINEKVGVAYGYSPNDVLRRHAVVSRASEDPVVLRNNRLGTVGLRGQLLFERASIVALLAPALRERPSSGVLSPYLERSNSDSQAVLRLSTRLGADTQAEVLLHGRSNGGAQTGLNLSSVFGDHLTAYAELALTREAGIVERALAVDPARPYAAPPAGHTSRARYSVGLNLTPQPHFSVGLELQGDDTALGRQALATLLDPVDGAALARYVSVARYAAASQDNLARRYGLVHARWTEPFGTRLSLAGFSRWNGYDHSRYSWLQAAYPQTSGSVALTLTHSGGRPGTEFGNGPARFTAQLSLDWNF